MYSKVWDEMTVAMIHHVNKRGLDHHAGPTKIIVYMVVQNVSFV